MPNVCLSTFLVLILSFLLVMLVVVFFVLKWTIYNKMLGAAISITHSLFLVG